MQAPGHRRLIPRRARRARPRPRSRRRRTARVVSIVLVLLLVPVAYSYATTMLQPSSLPWTIRTVEWIRGHGGAGVVSTIEHYYYTWTAPAKGGPALTALPALAGGKPDPAPPAHHRHAVQPYVPPRIRPVIHPALPGEGVWRPTRKWVGGVPAVRVTVFRPQKDYPRTVAYVAWVDASRTQLALYPGRYEPPGGPTRGPMQVPYGQRWRLLATFNSGFTYGDGHGGFAVNGSTYTPLQDGKATLLAYRDGRVAVRTWHGGSRPPGNVVLARQNASLLVDHGRLAPGVWNGSQSLWGYTLGNAVLVWRSAVGVDRRGNLIYAAADYQTVPSLAALMARAGAVRAMELDINAEWPTFNYYQGRGVQHPAKLVPNGQQSAGRYLTPDDRDFFAVYARTASESSGVPFR
jgi:Phosphodiester glycosidase